MCDRKLGWPQAAAKAFIRLWMRVWRHVGLAHRQPDKLRLLADVESLRAWVDCHKSPKATPENTVVWPKAWYVVCDELLDKATEKAGQSDVSGGYENLHMAEREAVPGMSDDERVVRAKSLRVEIKEKMSGDWRGIAVQDLLGKEDAPFVPVANLADAINHRNTHDRNMHRKMDKVRWQLAWLGLFIGALVAVAVVVGISLRNEDLPKNDLALLPYCIYLGLLGGLMSSAMSAKGTDRTAKVPEIGVEFYARVSRSMLGAAASIPVYIAGVEGIITIGGTEHSKSWGLLLMCFISGFSERWFRSTVAAVSGGEEKTASGGNENERGRRACTGASAWPRKE